MPKLVKVVIMQITVENTRAYYLNDIKLPQMQGLKVGLR